MTRDQVAEIAQTYLQVKSKFLKLVIVDAEKEFAELSQCGFGLDGVKEDAAADFEGVRGTYEDNSFVKDMKETITVLEARIEAFVKTLSKA